jgi:hypothetical protein
MDRRAFNKKLLLTVIGVPAARLLAACGDDNGTVTFDLSTPSTPPTTPADMASPPAAPADMASPPVSQDMSYTSSIVDGHSHSITLEASLFIGPPLHLSRQTTEADNHTHLVMLTDGELRTIAAGGTVIKNTSINDSHLHTFTFVNQA